MVEGATDACCGHGRDDRDGTAQCYPYVRFGDPREAEGDESMIEGDDALDWFDEHGIGPGRWFATLTEDEREAWADARLLPAGWDDMNEAEQEAWKAVHESPTDRLNRQRKVS
jgi:hypothetical protein